jgi:hypothetical protein
MTVQAGDVLAEADGYTLEPWWVELFNDALGEPKSGPDANLNPLFAYLVVQDVLDLQAFFAAASDGTPGHGLLHGEVEVEMLGSVGIRAGETYAVRVEVASVERKHGRTLGPFTVVTYEAAVDADRCDSRYRVRSRVIFQGPS